MNIAFLRSFYFDIKEAPPLTSSHYHLSTHPVIPSKNSPGHFLCSSDHLIIPPLTLDMHPFIGAAVAMAPVLVIAPYVVMVTGVGYMVLTRPRSSSDTTTTTTTSTATATTDSDTDHDENSPLGFTLHSNQEYRKAHLDIDLSAPLRLEHVPVAICLVAHRVLSLNGHVYNSPGIVEILGLDPSVLLSSKYIPTYNTTTATDTNTDTSTTTNTDSKTNTETNPDKAGKDINFEHRKDLVAKAWEETYDRLEQRYGNVPPFGGSILEYLAAVDMAVGLLTNEVAGPIYISAWEMKLDHLYQKTLQTRRRGQVVLQEVEKAEIRLQAFTHDCKGIWPRLGLEVPRVT